MAPQAASHPAHPIVTSSSRQAMIATSCLCVRDRRGRAARRSMDESCEHYARLKNTIYTVP